MPKRIHLATNVGVVFPVTTLMKELSSALKDKAAIGFSDRIDGNEENAFGRGWKTVALEVYRYTQANQSFKNQGLTDACFSGCRIAPPDRWPEPLAERGFDYVAQETSKSV